ncbi:60S ribosomal protein L28-like [Teleopsis dalmanni]|uniref:60S ribosomal protein L28-like n=1 Tax=Teleopsis dalmanni TaxID=139649 RepID=UPI0018CCD2F5|nr:60S ribosomal protein L28-like [Teleopsis dalmanni]XP_037939885.1 60S ribosomal protein L28-like [Teleopsis dalmanni]XP_037939892.1 60S ribosomal protein L28-like [Teleopsis dalmanni]XP_037939893.1 60S ribosomal protein L28-like [Teleopsis dalmanni]
MATTSPHLNWLIIRNNNSYLLKKRDVKKPFSTEPNNLTNLSSYRYNGLVHKKTLSIVPADKKGFTVVMKKGKNAQRPAKNTVTVTMKSGPRRSLKKLRNLLTDNKYRKDLTQAALRRASAVIRSQKPAQVKAKKSE